MSKKTNKLLLCFVFGTRPEIIKLAPVIKACQRRDIDFMTIHTGQHYSENMDKIFLDGLRLPDMDYNLRVGSGSHGRQTADMLVGIEEILAKTNPHVVVVQGDTNSVLSGALAACKLHIPIVHVEAGLRSYDRSMPEEINRILVGSVSEFHFTPTEQAGQNLLKEGILHQKIHVIGNTIVDAVRENVSIAENESSILEEIFATTRPYALTTVHRVENADSSSHMEQIIAALFDVIEEHDLDIVWPLHPRTRKKLEEFSLLEELLACEKIHILEPIGFFDMLQLQKNSHVIITDSGGIQEEACILGVPCVTLRSNTERPESVAVGANVLAGNDREAIKKSVRKMCLSDRAWENPFGDGQASEKVVSTLLDHFGEASV